MQLSFLKRGRLVKLSPEIFPGWSMQLVIQILEITSDSFGLYQVCFKRYPNTLDKW